MGDGSARGHMAEHLCSASRPAVPNFAAPHAAYGADVAQTSPSRPLPQLGRERPRLRLPSSYAAFAARRAPGPRTWCPVPRSASHAGHAGRSLHRALTALHHPPPARPPQCTARRRRARITSARRPVGRQMGRWAHIGMVCACVGVGRRSQWEALARVGCLALAPSCLAGYGWLAGWMDGPPCGAVSVTSPHAGAVRDGELAVRHARDGESGGPAGSESEASAWVIAVSPSRTAHDRTAAQPRNRSAAQAGRHSEAEARTVCGRARGGGVGPGVERWG